MAPVAAESDRKGVSDLVDAFFTVKASPKAQPRISDPSPAATSTPVAEQQREPPALEARLEAELLPSALGELGEPYEKRNLQEAYALSWPSAFVPLPSC